MRALVLALAALALAPATAHATQPCDCDDGWVVPRDNSLSVPLNVRIVVHGIDLNATSTVLLQGTTPVDATVEAFNQDTWILRPTSALAPNATYTIQVDSGGASTTTTFETGTTTDDRNPDVENIHATALPIAGACDEHVAATVLFEFVAPTEDTLEDLVTEVELTGPGGTFTIALNGTATVLADTTAGGSDWSSCFTNVPGADPDATYTAVVTVRDLAGNGTATPGPIPVQFTHFAGAGSGGGGGICQVVPGATRKPRRFALSLGLIAVMLALRRRR